MKHNLRPELHIQNYLSPIIVACINIRESMKLFSLFLHPFSHTCDMSNTSYVPLYTSVCVWINDWKFYYEIKLMQLYIFRIGHTCKKCNERNAEVILRLRDAYCKYVCILPRALAYNELLESVTNASYTFFAGNVS
jgi:hypothetical protein